MTLTEVFRMYKSMFDIQNGIKNITYCEQGHKTKLKMKPMKSYL